MRARYYSPEIKRFVNQDILLGGIGEGQTLNRYSYVTGKPISFVDPFGLEGVEYNHRCKMGSCHDYDGTPGRPMTSTEELILDLLMCLIPTGEFTLILPTFKQAKNFADNLKIAEALRDAKLEEIYKMSKTQQSKITTVVGAYDPKTGRVATGVKVTCKSNAGKCAEDLAAEALGNPENIEFTEVIRPRNSKVIPRCDRCVINYGPEY